MKNCYIYTRCASYEQAANSASIAYQERLCKEYAAKKGYKVIDTFEDLGVSGNTAERKGLSKLLSEVSLNPNSVVLVTEITRIARNYNDFNSFHNFIKKYNCRLECPNGEINDHFVDLLWSAFAQYEREMRSQRIKRGLAMRKKMKGNQNL